MIEKALSKAQALEQKNLTFFRTAMPAIYKQLTECDVKPSLVVNPDNGRIGIPYPGTNQDQYGGDSVSYAIREVTAFTEQVKKTSYSDPRVPGFLPHLIQPDAFRSTQTYLISHQGSVMGDEITNLDLVVFGVGLGYHVEQLVNKRSYRSITLVENNLANFRASLFCVDWESMLKALPNEHSVSIIVKSPTALGEQVYIHDLKVQCVELFPSLTSSAIRYTHGPVAEDYELEKKILVDYSSFVSVVYEKIGPDTQRLLNGLENTRNGIRILNLKDSQLPGDKPVAIVGAGPSLDIYIEQLRLYRDSFYLITVGTGLSSLLTYGMRPDAHLELEYKELATNLLKHVSAKHDLSDITLITTIEANPGFVPLFGKAYAFIPETSPLRELYTSDNILVQGGVNCANAALAVTAKLTGNDIYLFGIDYAFTNGEHHSETNISREAVLPEELGALRASTSRHSRVTRSTLGKEVGTKATLDSARLVMQDMIATYKNHIHNCSHGADIQGTDYTSVDNVSQVKNFRSDEHHPLNLVDKEADYSGSLNMIKSTFKGVFDVNQAIADSLSQYSSKRDQVFRMFRILREVRVKFGKPLCLYQILMSANRLPLITLYKCLNNLTEEEARTANELWVEDYRQYNKFVRTEIFKHIDAESHFVEGEWTTLNY